MCDASDGKGSVTTTVFWQQCSEAIVLHHNRKLACDNGGPITLTRHWAMYMSILEWMNFVKRTATAAAKIEPS